MYGRKAAKLVTELDLSTDLQSFNVSRRVPREMNYLLAKSY